MKTKLIIVAGILAVCIVLGSLIFLLTKNDPSAPNGGTNSGEVPPVIDDGTVKTVLCIGDSTTFGWDATGQVSDTYPNYMQKWAGEKMKVINAGYTAAQLVYTEGSDKCYREVCADKIVPADIAVIMLGTYDVINDWDARKDQVASELKTLVSLVKEKNADADIYICTSPYRLAGSKQKTQLLELVDIQRKFASDNGYKLIDVYQATYDRQTSYVHAELFALSLYEGTTNLNNFGREFLAATVYTELKNSYALPEIVYDRYAALNAPNVYTYPDDRDIIENSEFNGDNVNYGYVNGTRFWQGIPGIQYVEYADYADCGKTEGGRLWETWYSGGSGETGRNYVILVTSEDNGETWSDARVIIDPDGTGPVRAFDPVLWMDPNGRMWIFWNQEYETYTHDGMKGVWGMYTDDPYSQDPVWSDPVRLCNGVIMNKPTVIKDGSGNDIWLLPSYSFYTHTTTNTKEVGPNLYKFEGYNKPWSTYSYVNGESRLISDSILEHMLVQNTDGTLRLIVRTPSGLTEVTSNTYGKTWQRGSLMRNADGAVMSKTSSRSFISSIMDADGKITGKTQILIFHDNGTAARSDLTIALSEDSGKTWSYKLEIADAPGCSYPDACQAPDGTIYITYDIDRYSQKKVMLARVTVEDIKAGKLVSEGSSLAILINDNSTSGGSAPSADGWYELKGTEDTLIENLACVEPADNASVLCDLAPGVYPFVDRTHMAYHVPDCFKGAKLLKTSMDNGTVFKTVTSGELYILTPMKGMSYSNQQILENKGFSVVTDNIGDFLKTQLEKLVLMKKDVEVGEQFTLRKYSIVFAGANS